MTNQLDPCLSNPRQRSSSCSRPFINYFAAPNISVYTCGEIIHDRMKRAYGGVLINDAGRVLLRKPRGLHKTRVWTFAKGKPEDGETGEQTALREVFEETGVRARIIRRVAIPPEELQSQDEYFLMLPIEETGRFDDETTAILWATREEADELISMTQDDERRNRDLKILRFAFEAFTSANRLLPAPPLDLNGSA